jgi:putative ABC transport system substrate-binding protein
VIGFLNSGGPDANVSTLSGFRQGLRETGYVEGQNLAIQYRWADGQYDRLPAQVTELVNQRVALIFAGGPPAALAAKVATSTIPIVFTSGVDAVRLGLVASLNRPGGNITGISFLIDELAAKRLGLLHDVVPQARSIAALVNLGFADEADQLKGLQDAARSIGLQLHVMHAGVEGEFDTAFARMVELQAEALVVTADPFFLSRISQIVELAARYALPATYNLRAFALAGGLMSYDTSIADAYRQAGVYAGRILNGAKPADLPVMQPTKFEFVINLKTAKTLNLAIPPGVIAIADEVIE